jgi:hypothetical protein
MGALKNISNILKCGFYIAIIGVFFGLGVFVGRKSIKAPSPKPQIEYVKGDEVHDTTYVGKPYKVEMPADTADIIKGVIAAGLYEELWPNKIINDTITLTSEDTLAIIRDYAAKRTYKETLFDSDTLGTCEVDAIVQYNRLAAMAYTYTPIVKNVEKNYYEPPYLSGFAGFGTKTGKTNGVRDNLWNVNGGVFLKDKYGFQATYEHSSTLKNNYFGGSVLFKF